MKKAKKAIIITLIVIAILAALLFAAYEIAMDKVSKKAVKTIVKSEINNMLDSGEISLDEVKQLAGIETGNTEQGETAEISAPEPEKKPEEKPASQPEVSSAEKGVIVDQAAENVAEKIDPKERREILELIRKKLTREDLQALLSMLEGGLTWAESRQAVAIAEARFDEEELERVKTFWHKYKGNIKRAK